MSDSSGSQERRFLIFREKEDGWSWWERFTGYAVISAYLAFVIASWEYILSMPWTGLLILHGLPVFTLSILLVMLVFDLTTVGVE